MIVLDSTQKVTVKLTGSTTSDEPEFSASYADDDGAGLTAGGSYGETNGSSTVDVVAAPASGERLVKTMTFFNKDTVAATFIVEVDDNSTVRQLCEIAVPADRSLAYVDGQFKLNELTISSYTHPNHSGEVTSVADGAQTVQSSAITNRTEITSLVDADVLLVSDSQDSNNLKKAKIGNVAMPARFSTENKEGATIEAGQIVATHSSGTGVVLANATDTSVPAVGLMRAQTADTVSGDVQTDGVYELSDWTNVIGATTLSAKAKYYLDTTDGLLTATPPSTSGNIVQLVGRAISPTKLDISIGPRILLG
mgnify:CR=1 FL=1